jgi:hypothetical protein
VTVSIHTITFWLNAFIPRDVVGATAMLHDGEYKGLTALSGPPCYLTDQRDFSNDPRARSRMHSLVEINLDGEANLTQLHRCDDLIECDPVNGDLLRKARASTSKMSFRLVATVPIILIRMECRYLDLLYRPGFGIDEIEYSGTIQIDPAACTIDIDLMICLFPGFEGYAAIDDCPSAILFRHAPPPGILGLGPPRGANRRIRSRLDVDGFCGSSDEHSNNRV